MELGLPFIIAILLGLTTLLVFLVKSFRPKKDTHQEEHEEIEEEKPAPESKSAGDAPKKKKTEVKRSVKSAYSHPWLLSSLKGHTADITAMDFDSSGKHLATCAEDRFVIIWSTKDFDKKEHKHTRGKVDFDHGLYVKWSPDSKAIVVYKASANCVEVYKLTKKPDGKLGELEVAITFPEKHKQDVLGLGIDINGKYIMTCSTDNSLVIWTLKGEVLEEVNLNLATTYSAVLSPCGRFVIASGFTPDVKVFEVAFSKAGVFEKVQRAFELKGHTSGVYSVAANTASTRMATVSKDNSWKMFDTDIDYHKGQEPYLLFSVPFECAGGKPVISLSPDGLSVAVACGPHISFFSGITGKFIRKLEHVHEGNVKSLMFDPSNKYLLSCGDKHVRIFHNVVGYMAVIEDLEQKKKTAAHSAMKDRIVQQIADAKKFLKSLGES